MIQKDGRFALLVDDAPYLMLAAQVAQLQRLAGNASEGLARDGISQRQYRGAHQASWNIREPTASDWLR